MAGKASPGRRRSRAPDGTQQHRDWLSLVETTGPFLSLPVLRATWPTLDALEKPVRERLRREHTAWQADPTAQQQAWTEYVLRELLAWDDALRWQDEDDLTHLALDVPEHSSRVTPSFALVNPEGEAKPAATHLVGFVCPPGSHPTGRISGEAWSASAVDRAAQLCRARDVQLGLVTDGRWWTLIRAPRDHATTTATFDAIGWNDAAEREVVRAFVSLLCRRRFLGVPEDETLVALLEASEDSQEEITEALGVQVRQAVELLVAAIGRADTAQREHGENELSRVGADAIYHGAVVVMMRIVFLLFAEERKMLPSDNDLYAAAYSAGRLCNQLEQHALYEGEDELEHTFTAWHRLLALFHVVYYGVDHPRLWMYPHDGPLFDSSRFPWLPLDIDDRTVLHVLRALLYVEIGTGRNRERRKLSFRELDVEQIGYVYENLLGYDALRADEVTVSLVGKPGLECEVALRDLEGMAAETGNSAELAARISQAYKQSGVGSARGVERLLSVLSSVELDEHRRKLLAATRGDYPLTERLLPFSRLIRRDLRDLPVVLLPGELFVTESPLRNNTGTHYTPRHLAEQVVKDALEPLVYRHGPLQTSNEKEWEPKSKDEILALNVADIAMGSGAFLVSAARYLGDKLVEAWAREGDQRAMAAKISQVVGDTHEDPVVIDARREIIERCLYGVDINSTAVDMAKVSLWLVSMDPERPFTFLDDRLVAGDSLLGVTGLDQLRHMHCSPAKGQELHNDLFAWTESTDALLAKSADTRRRLTELPFTGDPLGWLDDKRKLLKECREDTRQLELLGDLLCGGLLANAADGERGLTRGAVQAARLANAVVRDAQEDDARQQAQAWLLTDSPDVGFPREPLHWPLVFADVFEEGGFDAVVGNQPYLGGQKLTGALGRAYREYLIQIIGNGVRGSADLIAYFVLRAHSLLKPTGQTGLIATNTLAQGDTREVGLDQIVASGVTIRKSIKSMPWPTRKAMLECCVVWTSGKQLGTEAIRVADGLPVKSITSSLASESRTAGAVHRLRANNGVCFQGATILGLGFTMSPDYAQDLIDQSPRNLKVLYPYLNGQDLNSSPSHAASRWAINFHDWPEEHAKAYPDCYERVNSFVKPEREQSKRKIYRDKWWQYAEKRPAMLNSIEGLERVIAVALVSKTVMPVMVPTGQVFSHMLGVFAVNDMAVLACLSSALHYW